MSEHTLPTPTPVVSREARPFWEAAAEGRLLLQRCGDCGAVIWYPRGLCPECTGSSLEWFQATGRGLIYSYTLNHRGIGPYENSAPYVLAYVELEEGPRILTNIVECDPASIWIGQPVEARFFPTDEVGLALVRFRPTDATT